MHVLDPSPEKKQKLTRKELLLAKLEAGKHEAARLASDEVQKVSLDVKLNRFETRTGTGKKKKKKH